MEDDFVYLFRFLDQTAVVDSNLLILFFCRFELVYLEKCLFNALLVE